MDKDSTLHLIGLALRAGKLEVGEEPVGAAARSREARLILLAGDAAANSYRRAGHFGEAGKVLFLETPFTKAELGQCVGRASCAMAAVTDIGFASAIAEKLREADPERYGPAADTLALQDEKAAEMRKQRKAREKNALRRKAPASKPAEKPAVRQSGKPSARPAGKPAGKPFVKPAGKPVSKSAPRQTGKPAAPRPPRPKQK